MGRKKKPKAKPQDFSAWSKGQTQTAPVGNAKSFKDLYEKAPQPKGSPRAPQNKRTQQYVQSYNPQKEQEFKEWTQSKVTGSAKDGRSKVLRQFDKSYGKNMDEKQSTILSQLGLPTTPPKKKSPYEDMMARQAKEAKMEKTASAKNSKALQAVAKDDSRGGGFFDNFTDFAKGFFTGDGQKMAEAGVKQGENQGKVGKEIDRAATHATNTALLGLPKALDNKSVAKGASMPEEYSQRKGAGKVADIAYDALGYIAPSTAAAKVLRGAGVTKGASKYGKEILQGNTKGNVSKLAAETAKEGAIIGGGMGVAEEAINGAINPDQFDLGQAAKNVAISTALGAALDPLVSVGGAYGKKFLNNRKQSKALEAISQSAQNATERRSSALTNLDSGFRKTDVTQPASNVREAAATSNVNKPIHLETTKMIQPKKVTPEEASLKLDAMDSPISYSQDIKTRMSPKDGAKALMRSFNREIVDGASDLKILERSLKDLDANNVLEAAPKTGLKVDDSLYKQARMLSSSSARAAISARDNFKPLYDRLNGYGLTSKDLDEYSLALHANDIHALNAQLGKSTVELMDEFDKITTKRPSEMTGKEVLTWQKQRNDILDKVGDLNPYALPESASPEWVESVLKKWENNPQMQESHRHFMAIQDANLQRAKEAGFLDEDMLSALRARHPNYVSLARDIGEDSVLGIGRTKAKSSILSRKGGSSDLKILPVTESAMRNHIMTIRNAEKNSMLQTIGKYADIDTDGTMFREVPEPVSGKTVTAYQDGVQKHYEVPEYLVNYLEKSQYKPDDGIVSKSAKSFADLVKKGSTHYNIPFHFVSAVRDSAQSALTSRTGQNPASVAMGFVDSFFGKTLEKATNGRFKSAVDTYEKMGGGATQFVSTSKDDIKSLAKSLETGSLDGNNKMIVLNPFKAIEKFGSTMERGARLGEFRQAQKKGLSEKDAFFEATDIMDYSQKGDAVKKANDYVPYLNAAIRGNARVIEAMRQDPVGFGTKAMTYITAPTLALYMSRFAPTTSEEQRRMIDNAPDYQKNLYWFAPVPNSDKVAVIPKPHFIGQVFANPVEHVLNQLTDSNSMTSKEETKQFLSEVGGILTPPNSVAGLNTLLELGANRDFFTGYDIESKFDEFKPKEERYNQYTSELSKSIGSLPVVNEVLSPAQIDHIIKKSTGSLGTQALDAIDAISAKTLDTPAKPKTLDDVFGKSANQFMFNEANSLGTGKAIEKAKYDERRFANTQEKKELKDTESATSYSKQFKDLNDEIKSIQEDTTMSSQEKKDAIVELRNEQRRIGSSFLEWYNSLQK